MRSVIETFEVATGRVREVLSVEGRVCAPNWAPEGDWLLVNSEGRLFRVPLDRPRLIGIDSGRAIRCNNDHGFSPDGQRILLSSHHEGKGAAVYAMPAVGGEPERITAARPSWWHGISRDGRTLVYAAARRGRTVDICTCDPDGGNEALLTGGEGHADGPDFSSDGSRIYYNCDRDGWAQIWVMDRVGRGQRPLFRDARVNWFPHPSPDGRFLVYLSYPPGTEGHPEDLPVSLVLCDPEGQSRNPVRAFTGGQGTINVPCWAPDGSAFAYVRYE